MHKATFERNLREAGYYLSGSGLYSKVWINDDTEVAIKIGSRPDDPYPIYAKAIVDLQEAGKLNPYLPRIYDITMRSHWYAVEMEKLEAVAFGSLEIRHEAERLMEVLERILLNDHRSPGSKIASYLMGFDPSIWEVVALLGLVMNARYSGEIMLDLHQANVMLRGSQIVITDPVCD